MAHAQRADETHQDWKNSDANYDSDVRRRDGVPAEKMYHTVNERNGKFRSRKVIIQS